VVSPEYAAKLRIENVLHFYPAKVKYDKKFVLEKKGFEEL
jgi:hypothetical protein